MKIVRKLSRKRLFDTVCYEYEWFFIPVPAKARDTIRPWFDRDLKVQVEPFAHGLAVLVYPKDLPMILRRMPEQFKRLVSARARGS